MDPAPRPPRARFPGAAGAGIFVLAAALRQLHLFATRDSWAVRYPMVDARAYHAKAVAILEGDWLGSQVFYQDPLYPYFLAGLYALFGTDSPWVLVLQALLDAGTAVLVYAIARRVFGPGTGVLAGVLAAFYKPFLYFDAFVEKTAFSVFLITAALALLLRADARGSRRGGWLAAGAVLGLASLTRGQYLAIAPVALVWILGARERSVRERAGSAAWLALGIALAILPVTARNYMVGGDLVLTQSGLGANLYIGNWSGNDTGNYRTPPFVRANPAYEETDFRAEAERRSGRTLTPSQVSRFWVTETLAGIAADPAGFGLHLARKARLFANHFEVPDNESYAYFATHVAPWLAWPGPSFGTLFPLALVGLWLAPRTRGAALLAGFLLVYSASVIAFFVVSRYRLPVAPIGIAFAAHGAVQLAALARERAWRRLAPLLVVLVAAALFAGQDIAHDDLAMSHFNLGGWHHESARRERVRSVEAVAAGDLETGRAARAEALRFYGLAESEFRQASEIRPEDARLRQKLRELRVERTRVARDTLQAPAAPER